LELKGTIVFASGTSLGSQGSLGSAVGFRVGVGSKVGVGSNVGVVVGVGFAVSVGTGENEGSRDVGFGVGAVALHAEIPAAKNNPSAAFLAKRIGNFSRPIMINDYIITIGFYKLILLICKHNFGKIGINESISTGFGFKNVTD
jgi:hypothetical protein